jgi:hypothetical protein
MQNLDLVCIVPKCFDQARTPAKLKLDDVTIMSLLVVGHKALFLVHDLTIGSLLVVGVIHKVS